MPSTESPERRRRRILGALSAASFLGVLLVVGLWVAVSPGPGLAASRVAPVGGQLSRVPSQPTVAGSIRVVQPIMASAAASLEGLLDLDNLEDDDDQKLCKLCASTLAARNGDCRFTRSSGRVGVVKKPFRAFLGRGPPLS